MNKKEYEEIQKTLTEVNAALARNDLTEIQRRNFQKNQAELTGLLFSVWLPFSNVRRAIMLFLFLLGLRAFFSHDNSFYFYWLAVTLFSPRIIGTSMYMVGRFKAGFKK